jgi:5-methylcytosine-specific restriction endonuclease McrA
MSTKRGDPRSKRKYKLVRLQVLARDEYTCQYCYSPDATTVDHIVPVSRSEPHMAYDPSNMIACCVRCNSSKGSRSQRSFLAKSATPPVFPERSLPDTVRIIPSSPFIKPEAIQVNAE